MQYFDVHNLATGEFILRATLPTIALIYRWCRAAERRVEASLTEPTDMFGHGLHEDVRVTPVLDDWKPQEVL